MTTKANNKRSTCQMWNNNNKRASKQLNCMLKTLNHYNKNNNNKGKQQKKCMLKPQQQAHRITAKEPLSEKQQKSLTKQQGVCHSVALPLTLKSILRQKKNYGN